MLGVEIRTVEAPKMRNLIKDRKVQFQRDMPMIDMCVVLLNIT